MKLPKCHFCCPKTCAWDRNCQRMNHSPQALWGRTAFLRERRQWETVCFQSVCSLKSQSCSTSESSRIQAHEITPIAKISKYNSLVLTDKADHLQEKKKKKLLWARHGSFLSDPCSLENDILLLQDDECEHLVDLYSVLNSIMRFSNIVNRYMHLVMTRKYTSLLNLLGMLRALYLHQCLNYAEGEDTKNPLFSKC